MSRLIGPLDCQSAGGFAFGSLPELPVRDLGLDRTAPASLYHFVGLPAVAF